MSARPSILLTNDDGIESPGLRACHRELTQVGTVTVVAPAADQSAVGRSLSSEVAVDEHDLGYVIHGTPADAVIAGIAGLDIDPDIVVAGCNRGANLGEYTLGRSGTVSAAVEAAFFNIPSLAISMFLPPSGPDSVGQTLEEYAIARKSLAHLVPASMESDVFAEADYLNVNVPLPQQATSEMHVTTPSHVVEMDAVPNGDHISLEDRIWERLARGEMPDPPGSDRRAVVEGHVSVSPLSAPHSTSFHPSLDRIVDSF